MASEPIVQRLLSIVAFLFILFVIFVSSAVVNVLQLLTFALVFLPPRERLAYRQNLSNSW